MFVFRSFVFLKIPVGITSDSLKRLQMVEESVNEQRWSGLSNIYSKIPIILGGFFGGMIGKAYKVDLPSGVMISLAIDEPIHFQGSRVKEILFISGPLPGNQGVCKKQLNTSFDGLMLF